MVNWRWATIVLACSMVFTSFASAASTGATKRTGGGGTNTGAAPTPKPPEPVSGVFKFITAEKGNAFGRPSVIVKIAPAFGNGQASMAVPSKTPDGTTLDPVEAIMETLKAAKPGDLFEITASKSDGGIMIQTLKTYDLQAGENEPNVFIFVKKTEQQVNKDQYSGLVVRKFGQDFTLLIPNKMGPEKKPIPDPDMMKTVDNFKDGDPLEVQALPSGQFQMLKSIKVFELPKKVEFSKVTTAKVDEKEIKAIEVKDGQTAITLNINPKSPNSVTLLGKVGQIKAGTSIMVRYSTDDKGNWLLDVRPAPKEETPKTDPPKGK